MALSPLHEMKVSIRIELALMWCAVMFFYIYGDYFALYIPNEVSKLMEGKTLLNSPLKLFAASVLMALPPVVILLSVIASATVARITNIIFGIIFTAIMVLIAITSIGPWWEAYVFYAVVESCITLMIVWKALKWPREN